MEDRVENSNGPRIPKKSKSLEVKTLYKSRTPTENPGMLQSKKLKRKSSVEVGGDENKKKKSRREISLSSLKKRKEKSLSDVSNAGSHFPSYDPDESKNNTDQKSSSSCGLSKLSLDENVLKIPKRKRGTLGRRKSNCSRELNPAEKPVRKLDFANPPVKSEDGNPDGTSNIENVGGMIDAKENGLGAINAGNVLLEQGHLAGNSIADNGKSVKKSVKNSRKRKNVELDSPTKPVKMDHPGDVSSKGFTEPQEDDEENLEENAARMLSSRFDTSCTGFSLNKNVTSNSFFFLLSSKKNSLDKGSTSCTSPNSESEAASRVLRPRNKHGERKHSRKRRHFYEVSARHMDAYWVLNKRIKVYWPLDKCWYHGLVNEYNEGTKLHHVKYDDRDEEWIDLQKERIKLLLLPGEAQTKAAQLKPDSNEEDIDERRRKVECTKEEEERPSTLPSDGCLGNYMDTEPIISWLARSNRGVKSSPSRAVKKRISGPSVNLKTSLSSVDDVDTNGTTIASLLRGSQTTSSVPTGRHFAANSVRGVENSTSFKGRKDPIVYFRRRFRTAGEALCHTTGGHTTGDDSFWLRKMNSSESSLTIGKTGFMKLTISLREVISYFEMNSLLLHPFGVEIFQSIGSYGALMTVLPMVKLEMLVVDTILGLRLLLFEGCLDKAIAFAISVLTLLNESNLEVKSDRLQAPVTSVRFKFSRVQGCKNQLAFEYSNFLRLEHSKWSSLESKLLRHCLLLQQLSPSECTYENVRTLQNGDIQLLLQAACNYSKEGLQTLARVGPHSLRLSKEHSWMNAVDSSVGSDSEHKKLPPFALSFMAAPTFFLSLHLKLVIEHSVSNLIFVEHNPVECAENARMEKCSLNGSEYNNDEEARLIDNACDKYFSGVKAGEDIVLADSSDNGLGNALHDNRGSGIEGVSGHTHDVGAHDGEKWQHNHQGSEKSTNLLLDSERPANGCSSHMNGIKVDVPQCDGLERSVDSESSSARPPTDCAWDTNGGLIPSPNPTAPRSMWNRSRSSSSQGHLPYGWPDSKSDYSASAFSNGPKKPRTHVTYSYPSGGLGLSCKQQLRMPPHKRIRKPNEKKALDISKVPQRNFELISCHANLLITVSDRGWRECGAEVVLELVDNEWNLAIKILGAKKYSYKAHQFMQPGSTNRYTHAMMWRGGKDWTLEFPDRSQWALFKEMHEECYNRNVRAASVKNIPIPGVRLTDDDDPGLEPSFVRGSMYYQQVETDVDMALNPSRVLYDMDSDDEQWISACQGSSDVNKDGVGILSVDAFERMMDMFEKKAYSQQCDQFTLEEIDGFMVGAGPMVLVRPIYEYWRQKRQKKGMPLIRHLQPPSWEKYQQQLREWELALTKGSTNTSDGCQKTTTERPSMFAFCMKPRGLEVPNKGSKQRSQKKFSVAGQSNGVHGDHDGFHTFGRRLNGATFMDDRGIYSGHFYGSSDNSQLAQTSPMLCTLRDVPGNGYTQMGGDGFDRNYHASLQRYKSKKFGGISSPRHSQMYTAYSKGIPGRKNNIHHWNSPRQLHLSEVSHRPSGEEWNQMDIKEYKLWDASAAARNASNLAKRKRERAERLLYRADIAVHRAVAALMTAEAIKASSEEKNGEG